jgi:hypothetical protein
LRGERSSFASFVILQAECLEIREVEPFTKKV